MTPHSDRQFLTVSHFDPTAIQVAYPGLSGLQLEPGAVEGWIHVVRVNQLQINTGSLNRATLYEGAYTKGVINVGVILDPDSTAVVQGHEYEAGAVSVDVGDVPMHEAFPSNMVWAAILVPIPQLLRALKIHSHTLLTQRHLALKGPREELEPLIALIHRCMNRKTALGNADARCLSSSIISTVCNLLQSRLVSNSHELPYAEGDQFLMQVVKASQQLAQNGDHQPLSLSAICEATGMKSRTLQKYFKALYGLGPTEYFRIRRLNSARNELIKANPETHRVSEIAAYWGFDHLGRFAVKYRHMFNESPSKTLKRTS